MIRLPRRNLWRILVSLAGLGLVFYLVHAAGPEKILLVLGQAAWWLPLIFALELLQLASDVLALRLLLGSRSARIPASAWVRSSALAYAIMVLVPAGRAAGEVARATVVAKYVGAPWAATAGTQLQSSYLLANSLLSTAAFTVVASRLGLKSPLALMLAGNALLMLALAASLLAVLRGDRAGKWIERVRKRFLRSDAPPQPVEPQARKRLPWRTTLVCTTSRGAQVGQYGVILAAVGGTPSVRGAFMAHGIHLVGATIGDVLPNQLGVVDGAYRVFAADIGFADAPARALSIAFVVHVTQLLCAGACVVIAAVSRKTAMAA